MYLLVAGVPYTLYFGAYRALASKRCPRIHCALYLVGMHCLSAQGMNIADERQESGNSVIAKGCAYVLGNGILSRLMLLGGSPSFTGTLFGVSGNRVLWRGECLAVDSSRDL